MSKKRFLLLSPDEIRKILIAHGFAQKKGRSGTSHEQWEGFVAGLRRIVTVPAYQVQDVRTMNSIIEQSGMARETFYGTDKKIAKRAGVKYSDVE